MDTRQPVGEARRSSAVVLGSPEQLVRDLLADALAEVQVLVHLEERFAPFDLIIAVVGKHNLRRVLAEAKLLAAHAPILVVMSMSDDDCEELALASGAAAYWALEWPITRLTGLVVAMLARRRRESGSTR
jgi:hypothetical protein